MDLSNVLTDLAPHPRVQWHLTGLVIAAAAKARTGVQAQAVQWDADLALVQQQYAAGFQDAAQTRVLGVRASALLQQLVQAVPGLGEAHYEALVPVWRQSVGEALGVDIGPMLGKAKKAPFNWAAAAALTGMIALAWNLIFGGSKEPEIVVVQLEE